MSGPAHLRPRRILAVVELDNGDLFGVELTPPGIKFQISLLDEDKIYRGGGLWEDIPWDAGFHSAEMTFQGRYQSQYISNAGEWVHQQTQKPRIGPGQLEIGSGQAETALNRGSDGPS